MKAIRVRLRNSDVAPLFDPVSGYGDYKIGDQVLVDSDKGRESGEVVEVGVDMGGDKLSEQIAKALKPVIRQMDKNDLAKIADLEATEQKAREALSSYLDDKNINVKILGVTVLFDNSKAFVSLVISDEINKGELAKAVSSKIGMPVEVTSSGSRQVAADISGIGICGMELCCGAWKQAFQTVNYKMAKDQGLSLNPEKSAGACGRLQCCLAYEVETYREFAKRAPKKGTVVDTPLGQAKITELDAIVEKLSIRFTEHDDHAQYRVPLTDFDCNKECAKCKLTEDALKEAGVRAYNGIDLSSTQVSTVDSAQVMDDAKSERQRNSDTAKRSDRADRPKRRSRSRGGERTREPRRDTTTNASRTRSSAPRQSAKSTQTTQPAPQVTASKPTPRRRHSSTDTK